MSAESNPTPVVYLMYHELERPERALCDADPGYVRYIVHETQFREQMNWLKSQGWKGQSVEQALSGAAPRGVVITFDDGAETDLIAAAPILKDLDFGATFYITTGFLGKRGYLSRTQVRELSELGFNIGCHSRTHPYLSDLAEEQLQSEILEPKIQIEQMIGRAVNHFSCPGGRWDARVVQATKQAAYRSMATSEARANCASSDPFCLGRVAIMRDTPLPLFQTWCAGHGLWKLQMAEQARSGAKRILGNRGYDRLRAMLLGRKESKE
ncbi:MAG TPA: polysaccharide deacetylase family protein [Terriglobales bacterium]|nr:polysaccharide deacetylase family protein [Terriglobales bacterium]